MNFTMMLVFMAVILLVQWGMGWLTDRWQREARAKQAQTFFDAGLVVAAAVMLEESRDRDQIVVGDLVDEVMKLKGQDARKVLATLTAKQEKRLAGKTVPVNAMLN